MTELKSSSDRFSLPQLDGLRFFSFLMILVHHHISVSDFFPPAMVGIATAVQMWFYVSVDVFFVLSSFLIVTLLAIERERTGTISLRRFYIRRLLRIWPLYFVSVPLLILILPIFAPALYKHGDVVAHQFIPFMLFGGNFSSAYFGDAQYVGHLWTIAVEEQFYLVIPVLMFMVPRLNRTVLFCGVGLLLFSMLVRLYIQLNALPYPFIWVLTPGRLDPFIIGAACSFVYLRRPHWLAGRYAGAILLAVAVGGILAIMPFGFVSDGSLNVSWQLTVVAVCAGCLLLSTLGHCGPAALLSFAPFVYFGKRSYGLYVFHFPIAFVAMHVFHIQDRVAHTRTVWLLLLIGFFVVTATLAVISFRWLEMPFINLKDSFAVVKSRVN